MSESVFICIEEDSLLVVIACTSVRMESEDIWANDFFDIKVHRFYWSGRGGQPKDWHGEKINVLKERRNLRCGHN